MYAAMWWGELAPGTLWHSYGVDWWVVGQMLVGLIEEQWLFDDHEIALWRKEAENFASVSVGDVQRLPEVRKLNAGR
jgi:hypothetical protein